MQTPKARTNSSQRKSPQSISSEKNSPQTASSEVSEKISPRVVRQLKTSPRYSVPTASSSSQATKAPKERSPLVLDYKSPRSPLSEKKRTNRVAELESQISQLENNLKIVKDQLCSTETSKKQAQKDVEESNRKLQDLSIKLEESQKQLLEKSHILEISEKKDSVLLSEFEADQKQHSDDSVVLASALDEIKQLKLQLEIVSETEATQIRNSESAQPKLHELNENLKENLLLLEDMKNELRLCKESEAHAQALVGETLLQLESAKKMVETLRSDGCKATEAYDAVVSELEQSRARVKFLEELVSKLKVDINVTKDENDHQNELENLEKRAQASTQEELTHMKLQVQELRSDLEAAEIRYTEEQARSTEQMKNAFEMMERIKSSSGQREAELEAELRKSRYLMEELKANIMDKETELQGICEENEDLRMKLENALSGCHGVQELEKGLQKSNLMEKLNKESSKGGISEEEVVSELEAARVAEAKALMKVQCMAEEVDKSNMKAARVAEQLEAAQTANAEMEAELRRLKVQSNQWRKAAEAAAAMLSAGNNGHLMERTGSMDSNYSSPTTGRISSRYTDDLDDDLLKKKNANMLKRIGDLWKKPQK